MANPICLSPLKFYDSLDKQERFKSYSFGHTSPVIMPFNILHPFQLVVSNNVSGISAAYIVDANLGTRITSNIAPSLEEIGLTVKTVGSYKVVMLPGNFPLLDVKYEGEFYLQLIDNNNLAYYSEVFCFTNALDDCLELEYWNPESDFVIKNGIITFADNFHFKILLKSELGKPEYSFEEEATRRLGYSFVESQVSKKIYKFNTILPEYLCDALRLVRLCSNKKLTSKGETYDMLSFEMDVDWQEQGDLASVNCEFEVDNIIINLGGFQHKLLGGDFSEDYNNDYKKQ